MLQAADIRLSYGDAPVLRGVGLDVASGDIVGILGPNGSGKTTLLRVLAGMLRPQAGRVLLDGRDVASIPRQLLARRLAVVPQEVHLAFDYTVLEIALMGRYPHLGAFELEGPFDVEVARAGAVVQEERLRPRLADVSAHEDAALGVGCVDPADGGHEHGLGVKDVIA